MAQLIHLLDSRPVLRFTIGQGLGIAQFYQCRVYFKATLTNKIRKKNYSPRVNLTYSYIF